jgi:hypothetical protein
MSTQEHRQQYRAWQHDPYSGRAGDTPIDCDCADTIRELLFEIAGTTAVFLLITLLVRSLG